MTSGRRLAESVTLKSQQTGSNYERVSKCVTTPADKNQYPRHCPRAGLAVAVIAALFFGFHSSALQDKNTQLQSRLDQTQWELARAKAKIAQLQPLATKARELPVSVTFRRAVVGAGYVIQIHNKSGKSLPLKITATNLTFNKTTTFDKVAGPVPLEIGHMEGWTFASGDLIEIASDGFDPLKTKIP